jgi:7-keto-8-aminopelargonate synthetase-like enzyme
MAHGTLDHVGEFNPACGGTPLASLINRLRDTPEVRRIRGLTRTNGALPLNNSVTFEVSGRQIVLEGRTVVNFGSFNYLGFEQRPEIIEAGIAGLKKYGNHSGCSRAFTSHDNLIRLESEVSALVGSDKTLICANVSQVHEGAIPALFSGRDSHLFIDKSAHMSMREAALIAKARGAAIAMVDAGRLHDLEQRLAQSPAKRRVLLTDGLDSMYGTVPDVPAIQRICDRTNTVLYIDDAHGIGVLGRNGGGVREQLSLSFDNMILVGSLQKGLGCFGGFVSGHATLIDILRATSRTYIFSGTLQPQAVEGARAAVALSKSDEVRAIRSALAERSRALRRRLREMSFDVPDGDTPIIPVRIGGDADVLAASRKLLEQGFYLHPVVYPAVPRNQGILRIALTASHSHQQTDGLVAAFAGLQSEPRPAPL